MFRKKGIALKAFLFFSMLIVAILIFSFLTLYFVLPDYYYYMKTTRLAKNIEALNSDIENKMNIVELSKILSQFCIDNNVTLASYTENNENIGFLSWPFISYLATATDEQVVYSLPDENSKFGSVTITFPYDMFVVEDLGDNSYYTDTTYSIAMSATIGEPLSDYDISSITSYSVTTEGSLLKTATVPAPANDNYSGNESISYMLALNHEYLDYVDYLLIDSTLQPINEASDVILSLLPYLLAADMAIALLATYLYVNKFTKPIIKISDTAESMQALNPGLESNIRTNDELGTLSENLDILYKKLLNNIETLQKEMDNATMLEKSKTDFLQAASHELKTPLAGLNGIVEGMIDSVGKYKDRDQYLGECKKLIDKMSVLVLEILNASRIDTENTTLSLEKIIIGDIVEEVLETYRMFINDRNITVACHYGELDYTLVTDKKLFKNVISNIISNAVKYTAEGGKINIGIYDNYEFNCFTIENQCANIPEEDLTRLFEPFFTGNYSRNRSSSGTGLGLYIVKRSLDRLKLQYGIINTDIGVRFSIYLK